MDLKKVKNILTVLCVLAFILVFAGFYFRPLHLAALVSIVVYVFIYWKYWRCPKCGKILGRGREIRCSHCGENSGVSLNFWF